MLYTWSYNPFNRRKWDSKQRRRCHTKCLFPVTQLHTFITIVSAPFGTEFSRIMWVVVLSYVEYVHCALCIAYRISFQFFFFRNRCNVSDSQLSINVEYDSLFGFIYKQLIVLTKQSICLMEVEGSALGLEVKSEAFEFWAKYL